MDEPYSPSDPSMISSEEEVVSFRHMMKPPKFDRRCSFETFMVQFSNCAEYNKWNEAQKRAHVRNSLENDAATILWDYGADTTASWKGLTELLETRFGGKAMSEKHRIELRNRRRKTDETLSSLHADIRRLAALAYKGVPPEMHDQVTCDSFLDALGDPELPFKIRERQPTDLDSALRIALQLEVWAKEMNRHRGSPRPERMEGRRVREINRKDEFYKGQDTTNSKIYRISPWKGKKPSWSACRRLSTTRSGQIRRAKCSRRTDNAAPATRTVPSELWRSGGCSAISRKRK